MPNPKEKQLVSEEMFAPLLSSLPEGPAPESTFTLLERDDGHKAVILRYELKNDILAQSDKPMIRQEEEDEKVYFNECMRSEFFGAQRVMLVLDPSSAAREGV